MSDIEATNTVDQPFFTDTDVPRLLRHKTRAEWGLSTIVETMQDRVALQFEDGRRRLFKHEFLHLLEPVDKPLDVTLGIVDSLRRMGGAKDKPSDKKPGAVTVTIDDQIAYFLKVYPAGFTSDAYVETHRDKAGKRSLKRHRDALVAAWGQAFGEVGVLDQLSREDPSEVHRRLGELLATTDLVGTAERKCFESIDRSHHAAIAERLTAHVLEESSATAFDDFVSALHGALGKSPSWELATLFRAAHAPTQHMVVRTRAAKLQAAYLRPHLRLPKVPNAASGHVLDQMGRELFERFSGLSPRDLFDVAEFMDITLKPAAIASITSMKKQGGAQREQAVVAVGEPVVPGASDPDVGVAGKPAVPGATDLNGAPTKDAA